MGPNKRPEKKRSIKKDALGKDRKEKKAKPEKVGWKRVRIDQDEPSTVDRHADNNEANTIISTGSSSSPVVNVSSSSFVNPSSDHGIVKGKKLAYQPKNLDPNIVAVRTGKRGRPRLVTREESKQYANSDIVEFGTTSHYTLYKTQNERHKTQLLKQEERQLRREIKAQEKEKKQQEKKMLQEQKRQRLREQQMQQQRLLQQQRDLRQKQQQQKSQQQKQQQQLMMAYHQQMGTNHPPAVQNKPLNYLDSTRSNILCDHFRYYLICSECKIESSGYKYYDIPSLKRKIERLEKYIQEKSKKVREVSGEEYCNDYVDFNKLSLKIVDIDIYREPGDISSEGEDFDSDEGEEFHDQAAVQEN